MNTLTSAVVELLGNSTQLDAAIARSAAGMEAAGRKMEAVGMRLSATLSLPLAAVGGAAAKLATTFDTEMTKIETLVGISRSQVDAWRSDVQKLGVATGRGPNELAKAMFVVTSAGARGAEALNILERSAKASAAGLGDTATVARAVTSAVQAFRKQGLTAAQATDILVATVREGNLEADTLAGSLGRVLGPAAAVGASFADVGAFIATFTRVGASAEIAATSLSAALSLAIHPPKQVRDAMEQAGYSVDQFRDAIRNKGIQAALKEMLDATQGNIDVIGQFIPNVRALRGILAAAGSQGEQYAQISRNIGDSTGVLDEAFTRTAQTAGFKFKQSLAALQTAGVRLGAVMLPALASVAQAVTRLAEGFSQVSAPTLKAVAAFIALGAAIGPVVLVGGKLLRLFALVASPAGVVIAILGTLAAVSWEVYKNWDVVAFQGTLLWTKIRTAVFDAVSSILGALAQLTSHIPLLGGKVANLQKQFDDFADNALAKSGDKIAGLEQRMASGAAETKTLGGAIDKLTGGVFGFSRQMEAATGATGDTSSQLAALQAQLGQNAPTSGLQTQAHAIDAALSDLQVALGGAATMAQLYGKSFDEPKAKADAYRAAIEALVSAGVTVNDTFGPQQQTLQGLAASYQQLNTAATAAAAAERAHQAAMQEGAQLTTALMTPQEAYNAQVQHLIDLANMGAISEATFGRAVNKAASDFQDASDTMSKAGDQVKGTMQNIATQGLDAFAAFATGAGNFIGNFVRRALAELAQLIAKLLIVKALSHFLPGGGDLLGGIGKIFGLAAGGPVTAGQPYIVGEKGPELFMPAASGRIISSGDLAAAGAGGGNTTVYLQLVGQDGAALTDVITVKQKNNENRRAVLKVPVTMVPEGGA